MNRLIDPRTYRRVVLTALTVLLIGLVSIPAANSAVAQETPPPTVDEIAFKGYDCDTGSLSFTVPVTNLPHNSIGFETLRFGASPDYTQGPGVNLVPEFGFNPSAVIAPYTGTLALSHPAPSTNEEGGAITFVDVYVNVYSIIVDPTNSFNLELADRSEATFPVDCGDSNNDLVQQLIATLIAILKSILNEQ